MLRNLQELMPLENAKVCMLSQLCILLQWKNVHGLYTIFCSILLNITLALQP